MRVLGNLLASLTAAVWLVAIAVMAIQNVAPISLRFFAWESIELPFGIALAFSVSAGFVAGAVLPLLWVGVRRVAPRRRAAAEPLEPWE